MEDIFRIVIIAVIAAILALSVKQQSPVFAVLITLASGVIILVATIGYLNEVVTTMKEYLNIAGISSSVYIPIVKTVGIAILVKITSSLCKDMGESAVAEKIELAGTGASVIICLPLLAEVFRLISGFI